MRAYLLGGHAAAEDGRGGEVAAVARVGCAHHVLGVPHLLGELRDRQSAVLLAAAGGQGGKANHEEVQPGEGDQVHRQLAQVGVQLACTHSIQYPGQCTIPWNDQQADKLLYCSWICQDTSMRAMEVQQQLIRKYSTSMLYTPTVSAVVEDDGGIITWEAQAAGDARHDGRDQVVEIAKVGGGQLEGAEADVIERLIVQDHALVSILHQLMH